MQQYIYGNIGRAGFKTVSSDRTGFFVSHASALSPLMYYDTASTHGELPKEEHKCFWLLTTNLSVPGGQDYLFLQESGMDVHRNAAVVQGCCSDPSDGELYDARFLQLLDVAFGSPKEALQTAERGDLAPLTMDALPRRNVATANLDAALLEGILLMLLRKERVVIQLPSVGARAMEDLSAAALRSEKKQRMFDWRYRGYAGYFQGIHHHTDGWGCRFDGGNARLDDDGL